MIVSDASQGTIFSPVCAVGGRASRPRYMGLMNEQGQILRCVMNGLRLRGVGVISKFPETA